MNWTGWRFREYCEVVLEAFGPPNCQLFGSSWGVRRAACVSLRWHRIVAGRTAGLTHNEQACILAGTAMDAYRL